MAEVDVVDGAVRGDQPEREVRELLFGVDDDDRALVVAGVDGDAGRHLGGLARPLAAHERLAELAVVRVDPDGAVLVDEQPARRVAADLGGAAARRSGIRGMRASLLRARGSCQSVASSEVERMPRAQARQRVRQRPLEPARVEPAAQPHLAAHELVLRAQLREGAGDAPDRRRRRRRRRAGRSSRASGAGSRAPP